jgi:hypothetical protein
LAITDYICSTLVNEPHLVSPMKFLNSVHNAASGYWGIATGSTQASTAISAFDCSFAGGLLEALTQCVADRVPVLLVGCDIAATGPLCSTNDSVGQLAVALVVAPQFTRCSRAEISWSLVTGPTCRRALRSEAARALSDNAMADSLALFETLALRDRAPLDMPLAEDLALRLQWSFLP